MLRAHGLYDRAFERKFQAFLAPEHELDALNLARSERTLNQVLIPMCPQTTTSVSSYLYICVLRSERTLLQVHIPITSKLLIGRNKIVYVAIVI